MVDPPNTSTELSRADKKKLEGIAGRSCFKTGRIVLPGGDVGHCSKIELEWKNLELGDLTSKC